MKMGDQKVIEYFLDISYHRMHKPCKFLREFNFAQTDEPLRIFPEKARNVDLLLKACIGGTG